MGEPLRLPAFLLLGAALAYITLLIGSFRLSAVFSLFFGLLLHLYEGYLAAFGQGALPKIAQNVGMLMIFFAVALPLWRVGIRYTKAEPRPKGAGALDPAACFRNLADFGLCRDGLRRLRWLRGDPRLQAGNGSLPEQSAGGENFSETVDKPENRLYNIGNLFT